MSPIIKILIMSIAVLIPLGYGWWRARLDERAVESLDLRKLTVAAQNTTRAFNDLIGPTYRAALATERFTTAYAEAQLAAFAHHLSQDL